MTRRFWLAFALFAICIFAITPALAHDSVIFEFAPDPWNSQRFDFAAASEPVYQVFQAPMTVSMSGITLWLDNAGSAGPITFTVFDSSMHQLTSFNGTVPHLAAKEGGTKVHFDIPGSIGVEGSQTYNLQITSSLSQLGIYDADRILLLEHNKLIPNQFVNGAAQIGQEIQPFSFKLALYGPVPESTYNPDPTITPSTSTEPTITPQITITNARIATSTATSATVAWTTNIATDSRVTIRTQLNPLYVIAGNSDQTLELEHTVVVSGLTPSVNYFADVFSGQGSALVLTTYTIAFRTPAGSPTPPTPPTTPPSTPPTTPPTTPPSSPPNTPPGGTSNPPGTPSSTPPGTTSTPPGGQTPGGPSGTSNPPGSNSNPGTTGPGGPSGTNGANTGPNGGGGGNNPEITITDGNHADSNTVNWPAGGTGGGSAYRIDVFDSNYDLERSVVVPAGSSSKEIAGLLSGTHHIIVYEKKTDGTFVKVAPQQSVVITHNRLALNVTVMSSILLAIAGIGFFVIRKFKHEQSVLPAEEGYNPDNF